MNSLLRGRRGAGTQPVLTSSVSRASISVSEKLRGSTELKRGAEVRPAARPLRAPPPSPAPRVVPVAGERPQLVVGERALQVVLVGVVEHGAHPLPAAHTHSTALAPRRAHSHPAPPGPDLTGTKPRPALGRRRRAPRGSAVRRATARSTASAAAPWRRRHSACAHSSAPPRAGLKPLPLVHAPCEQLLLFLLQAQY